MRLVPVALLVACSVEPLTAEGSGGSASVDFRLPVAHRVLPEAAGKRTKRQSRLQSLPSGTPSPSAFDLRFARSITDPDREPHGESARAPGPPALPGSTWSVIGDQPSGMLGTSVASAGDVNGDGYDDLVVGAPGYDRGQNDEGVALLYLGSPAGLSGAPVWIGEGGQVGAQLGFGVAMAGDVNADGYDDVLVGAAGWDGGRRDEGQVRLYLGSAAGLAAAPDWVVESDREASSFGMALAGAGDVNGDGYADVVLGAGSYDGPQVQGGMASLYLGSAAGLSATPDWTSLGTERNGYFGRSVSGAGDVNGDGFADVIVGAPGQNQPTGEGAAFVYLGSAAGLSTVPAWSAVAGDLNSLGQTVSNAGDVNADGFADVLVGAPLGDGTHVVDGGVELYLGSPQGLGAAPAWTSVGDVDFLELGYSLGAAGDVDGDGYDDVIVGQGGSPSAARVYFGRSTGLSPTPALVFEDDLRDNGPSSVAGAGDVDGDGFPDLAVGIFGYETELWRPDLGAVFVYTDLDTDGDGVSDRQDVCVETPDPEQLDADQDGIGNACDAPTLAVVGVVTPGAAVTLEATGAAPGEVVAFGGAFGAAGPGPCPAALGGLCLDLGAGAVQLGSAVADGLGIARRAVVVPAAVQPGATCVVQAAIRRGAGGADSTKSPPVEADAGARRGR